MNTISSHKKEFIHVEIVNKFMHSYTSIARYAFPGAAFILVMISVILSLSTATEVGGKKPIIFDKKIISALQNISEKIPLEEKIVSPNFTPILKYFTEREVYTPYSVDSYTSLLNLMDNRSDSYLLIFENQSDISGLTKVFKKENLPNILKDFEEIATYNTDFNRLHLLRKI